MKRLHKVKVGNLENFSLQQDLIQDLSKEQAEKINGGEVIYRGACVPYPPVKPIKKTK